MSKPVSESNSPIFNALRMEDFSVGVHLGCSAEERREKQEVRVTIELRFRCAPAGCQTDRLEDTLCYGQLSEVILAHCQAHEFNLIERLGSEIYQKVRLVVGTEVQLGVRLHKVRPPVPNLLGGSVFCCGDFAL